MKQKWLITLNVFLFWALHLSVIFSIQTPTGGGAGMASLGIFVISLGSLSASGSVGVLVLIVAHLMKRFDKLAIRPRLYVGVLLSLLIACMLFQGGMFLANGGEVNSFFLEALKDAAGI